MESGSRKIDGFDRKILEIVQLSNRKTTDQIADKVGLSPAAVQRRLKRLREQRIILSDVAVLDPRAVGREITILVQVKVEHERLDLLDEFKRDMKSNPMVQHCYYVTGSADFILIVVATSMDEYNAFTRSAFFGNENIRSFETNVVMERVKVGMFVPTTEVAM